MKYKFLKDAKFSLNGYQVVSAKKDEEHELSESVASSLASQGVIKLAEEKKTPVEKREKKVVEPEVKKSTKKASKKEVKAEEK